MEIFADLITRSLASGNAFSTIEENAKYAAKKGLKYMALTDYGPMAHGGPHPYFFGNMRVIPREMYGVKVLKGVALNIQDELGTVDLPVDTLLTLDIVLAGLRPNSGYPGKTEKEHTQALINTTFNYLIDVILLPDPDLYFINYDEVLKAIRLNNRILGITEGMVQKSYNYCKTVLEKAKDLEIKLVMGSGASLSSEIANMHSILHLLTQIGYPFELVLNTSHDLLEMLMRVKKVHSPRY